MTEKRFEQVYGEMGLFRVKDNKTGKYYKAVLCGNPFTETDKPILDVLNEIAKENEQLKCGNKNLKATLNDFINICNRLQSNPNDKQTVAVARDMLQNMGVDLE